MQGTLTYARCRDLLEKLVSLLEDRLGANLLAIALFGSVARGEGGPTSDLDLLVVHGEAPERMPGLFVEALRELRQSPEYRSLQSQGFLPDPYPVFFTATRLATHPWLLLDILDHGIILLDREGVLGAELTRLRERLQFLGARKVTLPDGTWFWDLKPDWRPGEVFEL